MDVCHQKDGTFSKWNTMNKTALRNWKQKLIRLLGEPELAAITRETSTCLSVCGWQSRKHKEPRLENDTFYMYMYVYV